VLDSPVRAPHWQRAVSMETKLQRAESRRLVNSSVAVHLRRVDVMCRLRLVVEVHHRRWGESYCRRVIGFALMNHQEPVVAVHPGASMARRRAVDLLDQALALILTCHPHLEHSAVGRQDYESEDQNLVADAECRDRPEILHSE
jgi:hypothetical protein